MAVPDRLGTTEAVTPKLACVVPVRRLRHG